MGTSSFVGMVVNDRYRAVYVHYDGYPGGVGNALLNYTSSESVLELISHGDRSSLEGPYYKDRGEDDVDPVDYFSFEDFYDACYQAGCEWYYVFNEGQWYFGNTYGSLKRDLVPLTTELVKETYEYD